MRMRSWFARSIVVAGTLVVLVGTAGPAAPPPRPRLEFWTISLQPFFTEYMNRLTADYEKANPGVDIRWVDVQFQAIEQKLLAPIARRVPPDVVNLNGEFTVRMAGQG